MNKKLTPGLYGTIDIGTKSVKAIVVEFDSKGNKRLLNTASVELAPFDTFVNEEEYNQQITEAISNLAKNLDLQKCRKIISLFYNRDLQVKLLDLPSSVKSDQLDQVLPWEAKKLLSPHYKEEPFTYSYCITRGNPLSIALAVVPLPLLNAHLKHFENTGIKPDSVYTDVFSTLALQPIVDIAGLPALSIVNFGHTGTHLNIFSAGKLKFYRYIPTGTSELTNPPRENELEMFSQKIRFSFDYFRAVSKLNQVDALFFMGGGSAIPEVLNYEQSYFSPTKINSVDVSSEIDISPVLSVNINDNLNPENNISLLPFVPAIGGCLADFREDSESMDLLTLIKKEEKEKNLEKIADTIPVILGIIAFLITSAFIYHSYTEKNAELGNLTIEVENINKRLKECKDILEEKNNTEKVNPIRLSKNSLEIVKPIIVNKNSLSYLLKFINNIKPKSLEISEILIRNKQEAEQIHLKTKEEMDSDIMNSDYNEESNSDNDYSESSKSENIDSYDIFSEPEEPKTKPKTIRKKSTPIKSKPLIYESKLSAPISEEQIKEDFSGKFVIIHGFADNSIDVSAFSDALTTNPVDKEGKILPSALLRYIGINLRNTDNKVEFLLKGELK